MNSMKLRNVSSPLIEIGRLVLAELARKRDPNTLTQADLDVAAGYMTEKYIQPGAWRNFLAGVVLPNSGFAQYSYDKPHLEHHKREYAERVLRRYRPDTPIIPDEQCAFCGADAVFIATREHVPLLNAQGYGNFGGLGEAGLPVCGVCLLAAHAIPLGCMIVEGKLLAIFSDDPVITRRLVHDAVKTNRGHLQMTGLEKMPGRRFHRTRMVEALADMQTRGERYQAVYGKAAITGYLFSNSGQSASIAMLEVSSDVLAFLRLIPTQGEDIWRAWNVAVTRAWQDPKKKPKEIDEDKSSDRRNTLYDDLFNLPDAAPSILRRYILPTKSWALIKFYMQRLMDMDAKTIELLQTLGDHFAEYIRREDKGFLFKFMREQNQTRWRQSLIEASYTRYRTGKDALLTSEQFLRAFAKPQGADRFWSWKLNRDIVTMRILEKLPADVLPNTGEEPLFPETNENEDSED